MIFYSGHEIWSRIQYTIPTDWCKIIAMPVIRNFEQAREALRPFYHQPDTHTYTLDRMRLLVNYLGNPQDKLKVIHVAGTSGKSSTAYYVSSLLTHSGLHVGLSVSPHVFEMNERVQINNVPLAEAEFCERLGNFIDLVNTGPVKPSYFELMVAFAYHYFATCKVDFAVIEVGLGGSIDGTNVISRDDKICIITDIGLDHTNILGKSLPEITAHKAGIIQPRNNVFIYTQVDEIMDVVRGVCTRQFAHLNELSLPAEQSFEVRKLPLFQQRNFYLALQAVIYALRRDKYPALSYEQLKDALNFQIPGRMEIIRTQNKIIILDGAHNGQKMKALVESIKAKFPQQSAASMVAFVGTRDDRWQHALRELASFADSIIITKFDHESDELPKKSMNPNDIADYLRSLGVMHSRNFSLLKACQNLMARPEKLLIVTGSLYLLADVRNIIQNQNYPKY
jgi:dihydrofolate synthase / folylpolyglutamate synthase